MQSDNKFLDDMAKMMNGLAGTMAGMGREAQEKMRERSKEWVVGLDLVTREEFEAVKEMAANARTEVELLKARLDALEKKTAAKPAAKAAPSEKKVASKTAAPKKPAAK